MATEIGKAYVQIIPSAKGITEKIKNEIEPGAAPAGTSAGNSMMGALKKTIIAAGLGTVMKDALLEGGKLQQSLGGIETLFKDNAHVVKQYANEAYKTTGLSANAYMENVTGFSASLLKSLGGDTAKAAKVANMAMVDMADNSNKMGTSMESIQIAYQGFAKQNYGMLDNLKLGYGGSRKEMERLLADAQKLTGVKYDINNLSDVYEAIHVIQGELGITGTTAKEAATTLQGSFASMRAAFTNLLGKLALGEDIQPSLEQLGQTVSTFLVGNLLPMIGNLLKGVPALVFGALSGIADQLEGILGKGTVEKIKTTLKGIRGAFEGVIGFLTGSLSKEGAVDLMKSFGIDEGTATNIITTFENIKNTLSTVYETLKNIASGVLNFIQELLGVNDTAGVVERLSAAFATFSGWVKKVADIMKGLADYFRENETAAGILKVVLSALIGLFLSLKTADGVTNLIDKIKNADKFMKVFKGTVSGLQSVFNFVKPAAAGFFNILMANPMILLVAAIAAVVAGLIYFFTQTETGKQIWSSFVEFLTNLWNGVKEFFSGLWEGIKTTIETVWNGIKEFFSTLWEGIKTTIETVWNGIKLFFSTLWDEIKLVVETVWNAIKEFFSTTWEAIKTTVETVWNGIKEFFGTLWEGIKSTVETVWNAIKEFFSTLWEGIKTTIETVWNTIKEFFSGLWEGIKTTVETVWNSIKEFFSTLWESIVTTATNIFNGFKEFLSRLWESIKEAVRSGWERIKETVSDLVNGIVKGAEKAWEDLKEGVSRAVERVKEFFGGFKDINLWDAGWEIITGFLNGLKRAYENVKEFIGGIATWIRDHKGPIEYDRKLLIPAGNAIMESLDKGLNDKFKLVKNTISGMADEINKEFTQEMTDIELGSVVSRDLSMDAFGMADFSVEDKNSEVINALNVVQGLLEKISNKDNNTYLDGEVLAKNSYDRQMTFVRREGI
nr:MAG TPA: tail tape measure protein [Caudoviricetes sp.]